MASSTFFKLATGAAFTLPGYPAKEDGTSVRYTKLDATRARDEFGRIWSFAPSMAIGAQGTEGQSGNVPSSGSGSGSGSGAAGKQGAKGDKGDKGDQGDPGPVGPAGNDGEGGLSYFYSLNTTVADPGDGFLRFDTDTLSAMTALLISKTTADGQAIAALLAQWASSTTMANQSTIIFVKDGVPSVFLAFSINGGYTDNGTWDAFGATFLSSGGTLLDGDSVKVFFSNTGNTGATGPNGGTSFIVIPSNSSVAVASGSQTFVFTSPIVTPDLVGWQIGSRVRAISTGNNANYMEGVVTAINILTSPLRYVNAAVLVDTIGGSGTHSDYVLSLVGAVGPSTNIFNYEADTSATTPPPASGFIRWNNATQTSATNLYIHSTAFDFANAELFLGLLASGSRLVIQDKSAVGNQIWTVSGAPTESALVWTVPVTFVSAGGTGSSNFANNEPLSLGLIFGGTGGGGGSTDILQVQVFS